jgi:hypothetical protein
VGVGEDGLTRPGWTPGRLPNPAQFRADIVRGTVSIDNAIGVRKFIIWIEKDLIDWTKPVQVYINKAPALNYRPKVLEPDLRVLFEELHRTGDRKMLYLGKIEIDGPG